MTFLMRDFEGAQLRVFFFGLLTEPTPGEADHADNDEHNADDCGRFHQFEATVAAALRSTE